MGTVPGSRGPGTVTGVRMPALTESPPWGAAYFPVFQALICCWPPVPDVTSIFRGWAFSATGIRTVRTPPS